MIVVLRATREHMPELIRDTELALSHKLEQMRRVRMLEKKQAAWKREDCFDGIETDAEIYEHTLSRLHTSFDSELLHTGLYNPRWPPNHKEFTLEKNIEVEILRMEILPSQPPPPPQYDSSLRRSPAAGTRFDKPGVPHAVMRHTELEGTFPCQVGVDDFLNVDCILEQE